jgi:type I restriction enzyme S subunit
MELMAVAEQSANGTAPSEWKRTTLIDLASHRKELFDDGDWIESEHITNTGVRLIQTGNIGIGIYLEKDAKKYIYPASFDKLRCKPLVEGDLLICRLADPAGRACVLPDLGENKVVTSVDVTIFRPPVEVADRRFLCSVFSTKEWFRSVSDRSGGTTHKRISRGALGRLDVLLPPIEEQRAIAEALSDVDALLSGLDRLIAKKRDLKEAAMQQLLTGQTRLPGFQGEWEVRRLDELADIRSGGTPSTSVHANWDGSILWCTPTDITALDGYKYINSTARTISEQGLKSSSAELIPSRSVVMTSRATIGSCAINTVPVTTNQGFKNFVPRPSVDVEFLYYLLQTQTQGFISLCGGSTFLEIGKAQLCAYETKVPPSQLEQTAIANVLSDMDDELAALGARRDKTRLLKQGMMQELLTGRTRLLKPEVAHA